MVPLVNAIAFMVLVVLLYNRHVRQRALPVELFFGSEKNSTSLCPKVSDHQTISRNFSFAAKSDGQWKTLLGPQGKSIFQYIRKDGSPMWNASEARTCLQKRHVVFIGDSVTRFIFLSLIYFLEFEKWHSDDLPGVCHLRGWSNSRDKDYHYVVFFEELRRIFGSHYYMNFEHFDRRNEFHHYRNPELDLQISFVGWFGVYPVRVPLQWTQPAAFSAHFCNQRESECWIGPATDFLTQMLPRLCPSDVILNTGAWNLAQWYDTPRLTREFLLELAKGGRQGVSPTRGRIFWRTMTNMNIKMLWLKEKRKIQADLLEDQLPIEILRSSGWGILDSGRISFGKQQG